MNGLRGTFDRNVLLCWRYFQVNRVLITVVQSIATSCGRLRCWLGALIRRTLRHQAIGRKNWLFLGSEQAGPRAAILFTVLAGAKRHRIEPWTYLRELLLRLHGDDSRLDEMLPDKWAANHPESVLTYRLEESRRKAARQSSRRRHARTHHLPR